jgi:micrococcal nuclease
VLPSAHKTKHTIKSLVFYLINFFIKVGVFKVGKKKELNKESKSQLTKRLIREKHPDVWLIENASIGGKLNVNDYGAFTKNGLIIYILSGEKQLMKVGEFPWPWGQQGEVDHFAIKSIFTFGHQQFVTGNKGKDVQKYLEGERNNTITIKPRKFSQKILGFRSGKRWKKVTASIGYLFILFFIIGLFNGNSSQNQSAQPVKQSAATNSGTVGSAKDEKKSSKSTDTSKKNNAQQSSKQNTNTTASSGSSAAPVPSTAPTPAPAATPSNSNPNLVPVTLVETVDGDTIKVNYEGKVQSVRYLLIDTPEDKKPGTCVQPYALDAANRNKQLVNSGQVELEFEPGKSKTDKYGRLLAYVFVNGSSVEETLLKEGYARVAYIYEPPYKYLSQYQSDESIAKNKELNIWSKAGYVTDNGFVGCVSSSAGSTPKQSSPSPTPTPAPSAPSTSGSTQIFANCTALRKVYPNGVPSSSPAYQPKLDRDHDGWACETN